MAGVRSDDGLNSVQAIELTPITPLETCLTDEKAACGADAVQPAERQVAPWRRRGFIVLRILLGAVLLGAALMKDFSPADASFSGPLEWLSDPFWRLAVAEVEAVLGLWLLAGLFKRALWWAALVWFCGLAGTSLYLGFAGQPSCGCFGEKLPLSPWYAFGLDGVALAALLLFRPPYVWRIDGADLRRLLLTGAAAAGILAALAIGLTLAYGSPREALYHLRGEAIAVDPPFSDMGDGQPADMRLVQIRLVNHTEHPVRVYGGKADCSCVVWDDLPVVVPPRGNQSVAIRVTFRGSPGPVKHSFVFFTDDPAQATAYGEVRGRVLPKTGS